MNYVKFDLLIKSNFLFLVACKYLIMPRRQVGKYYCFYTLLWTIDKKVSVRV